MSLKTTETMGRSAGAVDSVVALLGGLIDYAGLFPPASLGMAAAVTNYAAYSGSEDGWMLGRFILPAARLGEFEGVLAALPTGAPQTGSRWELSVLPGADVSADLTQIREFNDQFVAFRSSTQVEIKSVEMKVASGGDVERLSGIIPAEIETYFEIPLASSETPSCERDCIVAVANCGRRAKIRTGGETADKFPAPESVIEFIRLCAAANVAFKATAGLHHPLRSMHRFTYQRESPSGIMHGFLNVFLAAAFLRAGLDSGSALQLLKEQSAQAFQFESEGVIWREHRLSVRDIAAARREFSISFGSCSFTEPGDDLRALRLL